MSTGQAEPRTAVRKGKACIPCHDRKVRCNAIEVGLPCTRCVKSSRVASCIMLPAPESSRGASKRRRINSPTRVNDGSTNIPSSTTQQSRSPPPAPSSSTENIVDTDHPQVAQSPESLFAASSHQVAERTNSLPTPPANPDPGPSSSEYPQSSLTLLPQFENQARSPTNIPTNTDVSLSGNSEAVPEDESQLQICREMSLWGTDAVTATRIKPLDQGREVIEYYGGTNQITILSDVFAKGSPKRLVRIVLSDQNLAPGQERELLGLDAADIDYLHHKGAFLTPSTQALEKLLRLYFECVYPYAPILDRVDFLRDRENGIFSTFLLQTILASAIPYASEELLHDCGFQDHATAQKTFFFRANLLCDMGAEKSQLRLLQGSVILSLLHFSLVMEKDYRYWLSNAVRLATKMGLHRENSGKDLDPSTRKLFRRIWWVIYNRDALLVVNGLDNLRRLHDCDFDTAELIEADWEEETIPVQYQHILPPFTDLQKIFLIESCKLSHISAQFVQTFATPRVSPSEDDFQHLEDLLIAWRRSLPSEMRAAEVLEWSVSNVWVLVLMARSYLFECIIYRTVRNHFRGTNTCLASRASQRLQGAMLDLDTTIDRTLIHNLATFCPLFLMNCAATVLALHIENALQKSSRSHTRQLARTRIHSGLAYLRSLPTSWSPIKWTLRMFEVIVSRTGLSLEVGKEPDFILRSDNPFNYKIQNPSRAIIGDGGINHGAFDFLGSSDYNFNMPDLHDTLGPMIGVNSGDWLQELFGTNFAGLTDTLQMLD